MRSLLSRFFGASGPPEVLAAYLFGSHGRGTAHAQSDVDVAVLLDRRFLPTRADRTAYAQRLASSLIDATHRNEVDVIVLNDAPHELAVTAIDAGAPLFTARGGADETVHAFVRGARLGLADLQPFLARTRRLKLEAAVR